MDDENQIQQLVDRLNEVWLTGDARPLHQIVDSDAVLVLLELDQQAQGREKYIQLTETLLREMNNRKFRFGRRTLRVWGDTAVVRQPCELSFVLERLAYTDSCSITMTFARTQGEWQLVWTDVFVRTKAGLQGTAELIDG